MLFPVIWLSLATIHLSIINLLNTQSPAPQIKGRIVLHFKNISIDIHPSPNPVIIPSTGGRWRTEWKVTTRQINSKNKQRDSYQRSTLFICAELLLTSGIPFERKRKRIEAGTSQFTNDGTSNKKNCWNSTSSPFCRTIKVVISPKGLKAPPALAATTTLTHAMTTNLVLDLPADIITVDISKAVVRLSAKGERQNEITPVIQNMTFREKCREINHEDKESKTTRSFMVLI